MNHKKFDQKVNFSIERVGVSNSEKIRKAQLINEYLKQNKVQGILADHRKSLILNQIRKNIVLFMVKRLIILKEVELIHEF